MPRRNTASCRGEFIRPTLDALLATGGAHRAVAPFRSSALRTGVGRRRVLARDQRLATHTLRSGAVLSSARATGCALHNAWLAFVSWPHSIGRAGGSIGFALLGESLFPNARMAGPSKVTKNACPCIRVSLRSTSLIPSPLRGSPRKGHPWPFTAFAASMPLSPLRSDSIRPAERGVRCRLMVGARKNRKSVSTHPHNQNGNFVGWKTAKHFPPRSAWESSAPYRSCKRWVSFALPTLHVPPATAALHAPSDATESPLPEGRAQVARKGLSGMDAARELGVPPTMGQGWPFAAGPWSVTGAREPRRSRGRMQGQAFLLTFLATEKSESPSRAKPMLQPTPPIGRTPRAPSQIASRASLLLQNPRKNSALKLPNLVAPRCDSNEKRLPVCA